MYKCTSKRTFQSNKKKYLLMTLKWLKNWTFQESHYEASSCFTIFSLSFNFFLPFANLETLMSLWQRSEGFQSKTSISYQSKRFWICEWYMIVRKQYVFKIKEWICENIRLLLKSQTEDEIEKIKWKVHKNFNIEGYHIQMLC